MSKKEYLTFINLPELMEGKEILLAIRDLTPGARKYDCRYVKAIVSASAEKIPEGDILWVRSWSGYLYPNACRIKIISEAGEVIPGAPHGEPVGTEQAALSREKIPPSAP